MSTPNPQSFSCPQCGQVDMVQKVSALVEGGTVAGVYSNTYGTQVAGLSLSTKASQLVRPTAPYLADPWGTFSKTSKFLLMVVIGIFLILAFIQIVEPLFSISDKLLGLIAYGIIIAICLGIIRAINQNKEKKRRVIQAQYDIKKAQWESAMSKWNNLYYCARNDVVFLSGKAGACVPASEMSRLLYRP